MLAFVRIDHAPLLEPLISQPLPEDLCSMELHVLKLGDLTGRTSHNFCCNCHTPATAFRFIVRKTYSLDHVDL